MRSILFVPGDSARKFEKACGTAADALVLDLEDSVSLANKALARRETAGFLQQSPRAKYLMVRVNAFDTGETLGDLAAVMPHRPDGILLPKCRGGADVRELAHYLAAFEAAFELMPGSTDIYVVATETAEAMQGLSTYAPAHPRLKGMLWGAEDLAASLGALSNRDGADYSGPFILARNMCLMAAAAAGVTAIDTVCTAIGDLEYVADESRAARRDGFGAKMVIHPSHIEPVNAAFTPTEAEVSWAEEVLRHFAQNPNSGVVQIGGKMIDKPHARAAEKILIAAGRELP